AFSAVSLHSKKKGRADRDRPAPFLLRLNADHIIGFGPPAGGGRPGTIGFGTIGIGVIGRGPLGIGGPLGAAPIGAAPVGAPGRVSSSGGSRHVVPQSDVDLTDTDCSPGTTARR